MPVDATRPRSRLKAPPLERPKSKLGPHPPPGPPPPHLLSPLDPPPTGPPPVIGPPPTGPPPTGPPPVVGLPLQKFLGYLNARAAALAKAAAFAVQILENVERRNLESSEHEGGSGPNSKATTKVKREITEDEELVRLSKRRRVCRVSAAGQATTGAAGSTADASAAGQATAKKGGRLRTPPKAAGSTADASAARKATARKSAPPARKSGPQPRPAVLTSIEQEDQAADEAWTTTSCEEDEPGGKEWSPQVGMARGGVATGGMAPGWHGDYWHGDWWHGDWWHGWGSARTTTSREEDPGGDEMWCGDWRYGWESPHSDCAY